MNNGNLPVVRISTDALQHLAVMLKGEAFRNDRQAIIKLLTSCKNKTFLVMPDFPIETYTLRLKTNNQPSDDQVIPASRANPVTEQESEDLFAGFINSIGDDDTE